MDESRFIQLICPTQKVWNVKKGIDRKETMVTNESGFIIDLQNLITLILEQDF